MYAVFGTFVVASMVSVMSPWRRSAIGSRRSRRGLRARSSPRRVAAAEKDLRIPRRLA